MSDDDKLVRDLNAYSEANDNELGALASDAANRIEELLGEVEDANDELTSAQAEIDSMEADDSYANAIYEAIVERRTSDAVELLEKAFQTKFIDPRSYQKMFSDRVKNG